jgi:mannose-6-phosphate isomerase-like protein (cupin superfamily)/pyrimidine operon attenuation protein/uracil phosphoribosyltransferase
MNAQVRSKQPIDASYSDRLIQRLAHEIREACDDWADPTLLVYVHDPDAPGGSEVEKRIKRYLASANVAGPDSIQIRVSGRSVRWVDRRSEDIDAQLLSRRRYSRAVIVDSVSFTGRTLALATESVRRLFSGIDVYWAVLIVSKSLLGNLEALGIERNRLLSVFESDRHDIFFPWGWTQATSSITRTIPVHLGEHAVSVVQRPWGTSEILVDQQLCSVRLHTIRAGERRSYQRHSLRDEFLVALDDYVGLEFDSEDGYVIEAAMLSRGDYLAVPRGVRYRLAAYRDSVRILELAFGIYDQVFDIERFADEYDRVHDLGDV